MTLVEERKTRLFVGHPKAHPSESEFMDSLRSEERNGRNMMSEFYNCTAFFCFNIIILINLTWVIQYKGGKNNEKTNFQKFLLTLIQLYWRVWLAHRTTHFTRYLNPERYRLMENFLWQCCGWICTDEQNLLQCCFAFCTYSNYKVLVLYSFTVFFLLQWVTNRIKWSIFNLITCIYKSSAQNHVAASLIVSFSTRLLWRSEQGGAGNCSCVRSALESTDFI